MTMRTKQIDKILSRNFATRKYYRGCFASDKITDNVLIGLPSCIVVNMDPDGMPGSHWVAMYFPRVGCVEYYDSLGMWPPPSPVICQYLDKFDRIQYNRTIIQTGKAENCGKHAIYFLYHRCSGLQFGQIMNRLARLERSTRNVKVSAFIRRKIFNISDEKI